MHSLMPVFYVHPGGTVSNQFRTLIDLAEQIVCQTVSLTIALDWRDCWSIVWGDDSETNIAPPSQSLGINQARVQDVVAHPQI